MHAGELRIETFQMPGATFGELNPLPPIGTSKKASVLPKKFHPSIPEEDSQNLGYGTRISRMPYRMKDSYGRERTNRNFKVAVLENSFLRAMFLLELGGRLWSLVHKPSGRELLECNPVFQPANIAFRDAWFSGGVEWNAAVPGHSPHTCDSVFAARVAGPDGAPVLRLYEWDRIYGVPYQMDFRFSPDGVALLMQVRLLNPNDREIPAWWWSNIAVPEREDVRVLVPTDITYIHDYKYGVAPADMPYVGGIDGNDSNESIDVSYSTNLSKAKDFFFRIPDGARPWISALDGEGRGLVQTSTKRLKGRKLFVWGTSPGSESWQTWLSVSGKAYIEIQAGLTRTQAECIPMEAEADWSWLEAYTLMEAPPEIVHGKDWLAARTDVEQRLDKLLPSETMDAQYARGLEISNLEPEEILHRGSGWGALERRRRERMGEKAFCSNALRFEDDGLDDDQTPWLALLGDGELPYSPPDKYPGAWMVQKPWREMLEDAVENGRGDHWLSWLHLGVMRYYADEPELAGEAWKKSLELERSGWALRNLAVAAMSEDRDTEAVDLLCEAASLLPHVSQLARECAKALVENGQHQRALEYIDGLGRDTQSLPRIRLYRAMADLGVGNYDAVERFLINGVVLPDRREGEVSLTNLWFDMHSKRVAALENTPVDDKLRERVRKEFPPPAEIDFRSMSE